MLDRGEAGLAVGLLLRRGRGSVPVQGVAGQVPGQVPRRRRHAVLRPRLLRDPLLARRAAVLAPVAGFAALETRAARAARGSRALRRRVRHLRPTAFVFSVAIEGRDPNESRDAVCADVDRSDVSDRRVFSKNELAFREDANAQPSSRAPQNRNRDRHHRGILLKNRSKPKGQSR